MTETSPSWGEPVRRPRAAPLRFTLPTPPQRDDVAAIRETAEVPPGRDSDPERFPALPADGGRTTAAPETSPRARAAATPDPVPAPDEQDIPRRPRPPADGGRVHRAPTSEEN